MERMNIFLKMNDSSGFPFNKYVWLEGVLVIRIPTLLCGLVGTPRTLYFIQSSTEEWIRK
jgi:hypothetical protein